MLKFHINNSVHIGKKLCAKNSFIVRYLFAPLKTYLEGGNTAAIHNLYFLRGGTYPSFTPLGFRFRFSFTWTEVSGNDLIGIYNADFKDVSSMTHPPFDPPMLILF